MGGSQRQVEVTNNKQSEHTHLSSINRQVCRCTTNQPNTNKETNESTLFFGLDGQRCSNAFEWQCTFVSESTLFEYCSSIVARWNGSKSKIVFMFFGDESRNGLACWTGWFVLKRTLLGYSIIICVPWKWSSSTVTVCPHTTLQKETTVSETNQPERTQMFAHTRFTRILILLNTPSSTNQTTT